MKLETQILLLKEENARLKVENEALKAQFNTANEIANKKTKEVEQLSKGGIVTKLKNLFK